MCVYYMCMFTSLSKRKVSCENKITYHHSRQLHLQACPSGALGNAQGLWICWGHNCFSGNYFLQPDHIIWFLPSSRVVATTYNRKKENFSSFIDPGIIECHTKLQNTFKKSKNYLDMQCKKRESNHVIIYDTNLAKLYISKWNHHDP